MTRDGVTRKERDRQLRRTDILNASGRVFAAKGYDRATIQDIAKEAQYAVGTVYIYFKNKESLYFSLVADKVAAMVSNIRLKAEGIKDAKRKILIFIQEAIIFFEKNQDFFRIFVSERGKHQWTIDRKLSQCHELRNLKFLTELITFAQKEGVIRKDIGSAQIADMLASLFVSAIFGWLNQEPGQKRDLQEMAGSVFDVFFNGVRSRPDTKGFSA